MITPMEAGNSAIAKRVMSDTELRHRKKAQGAISRTTGALGLTALGTLAAHKVPMKLAARGGKWAKVAVNPKTMKDVSTGTAIGATGIGGAGSFNFASYTDAEAKRRAVVAKNDPFNVSKVATTSANYHVLQHLHPGNWAGLVRTNPQLDAFAVGTGAAVGAQHKKLDNKRTEKQKRHADYATAGALGAAGGQAAYQGAGYTAKLTNKIANDKKIYHNPKRREGYKKREYQKANEAAKSKAGLNTPGGNRRFHLYMRNFPKNVPGHTVNRILGHTHGGNTGALVGTAATVAGGVAALKAQHSHNKNMDAGKGRRTPRGMLDTKVTKSDSMLGFALDHPNIEGIAKRMDIST